MLVTREPLTSAEFLALHGAAYDVPDQHDASSPSGAGSVMHEEGRVLAGYARKVGGPVLEIGAQRAVSTMYILDGLRGGAGIQNNQVTSLDLNHQRPLPAFVNLRQVSADSARWRTGAKFLWAFVDGDHTYEGVAADIETCLAHGCRAILFHDTVPCNQGKAHRDFFDRPGTVGVRQAIWDRFAEAPGWALLELGTFCGMAFVEKTE